MKPLFPVMFCVMLFAGCQKAEPPAPGVRPALVQKVIESDAGDRTVYPGEIRARHEADLAFRIGGKVVARLVDVGAIVRKGQVLAQLDPQDVVLAAQSATAQAAAAEADHAFAKAELERTRKLVDQKFVSQTVLEAKQASYDASRARLSQAQSQATVAANQAGYAKLVADQDGVITAVFVDAGQVVGAGQAVMKLARPDQKEVLINVPEHRVEVLRKPVKVLVSGWVRPEVLVAGRVREIAPAADATTRTFGVRISIPDPLPEMKLGTTANVLFAMDDARQPGHVLLPLTALTQHDGKPAVWVVDPTSSAVTIRTVQIGHYREDGVTVLSGLKKGELVVVAGVHKISAGQRVRPIEPATGGRQP